jgi:hypothetical protein
MSFSISISEVSREKLGSGGEPERMILGRIGLFAKDLLGSRENSWRDIDWKGEGNARGLDHGTRLRNEVVHLQDMIDIGRESDRCTF